MVLDYSGEQQSVSCGVLANCRAVICVELKTLSSWVSDWPLTEVCSALISSLPFIIRKIRIRCRQMWSLRPWGQSGFYCSTDTGGRGRISVWSLLHFALTIKKYIYHYYHPWRKALVRVWSARRLHTAAPQRRRMQRTNSSVHLVYDLRL